MNLTTEPDEHMRWIYDKSHPDYSSDMAKDLRNRREYALENMPKWMLQQSGVNALRMRPK